MCLIHISTRTALLLALVVATEEYSPPVGCVTAAGPRGNSTLLYLGNGCFWERQWAYLNIEMHDFKRPDAALTSVVGYAGGRAPPENDYVCYHTGDAHDYSSLGHAEVTRVEVENPAQAVALARDFFASFQGDDGARVRPDPMDMGSPYRSVIGLPGGSLNPLFAVFEAANVHGMTLRVSEDGSDDDELNVVWVMDSDKFGFWPAEVYHQLHCNFFMNEGMPYPRSYWDTLWHKLQDACVIAPTGCPEDSPLTPHPGHLCAT